MAEDTTQEKTEDPTQRKLDKAREKGQVPRSREMGTVSVLVASAGGMFIIGSYLGTSVVTMTKKIMTLERGVLMDPTAMFNVWGVVVSEIALPLLSFIVFLSICAIGGNLLVGGLSFSTEAMALKLEKLSPLRGFKRMFGVQALVELVKAILKSTLVMVVAAFLLYLYIDEILFIPFESLDKNIKHALDMLLFLFIMLCLSLLVVVMIDIPFQIWKHSKDLRMTKQEVKDERKNTDGNPEIKSRIRKLQYEISQRRMMQDLPDADAVIVNPDHFAVAVKYDTMKAKAPFVIAKGVDGMAFKIREIANEFNIPIVVSPKLARALYYTTRIGQEIPEPLYVAVAQVLAYVYQLNLYKQGQGKRPTSLPQEFDLPEEMEY